MRVRNAYTAGLDALAPGEEGDVDEKNAAVAAWIAAGMLIPVEVAPSLDSAAEAQKKRKG